MATVFSHDFEDNSLAAYTNDFNPTLAAVSTTRAFSGSRSARTLSSGTASRLRRSLTAGRTFGVSVRFYREDVGDAAPIIFGIAGGAGAMESPIVWIQYVDELLLRCNSGGGDLVLDGSGEGIALPVDTWTLIEYAVDLTANPWKVKWRVAGVDLGEHTHAAAAADLTEFAFGSWGALWTSWDQYVDDVLVVDTYDFPGAGQVILPDADLATTGWTTAPLFSKINDASDATIITASST